GVAKAGAGTDAAHGHDGFAPIDAPYDVDLPGFDWLGDPAWKPVSTLPGCDVRVADGGVLPPWPGFLWKSCGPGCEHADVVAGPEAIFKGAQRFGSRSVLVGGEPILTLAAAVRQTNQPGVAWGMTIHGRTELPIAFLGEFSATCLGSFPGLSTNAFALRVNGAGATVLVGHVPVQPGGTVVWASPVLTNSNGAFLARPAGWMELRAEALLRESPALTSTAFTTVHTIPGGAYRALPVGETVAWVEFGSRITIGGWSAKRGGRTLVQDPAYHAAHFAAGSNWLAWVGVTGSQADQGSYDTARLYWAAFNSDPENVTAEHSISLPVANSVEPIVGGGNYVAMQAGTAPLPSRMIVVNVTDKSAWSIDGSLDGYATPLAVFDDTLLVMRATPGLLQPAQYYDDLIRYDLKQLSSFAKKLP
ncbi:MAG: hypothetical protein Q8N51_00385, partial [Gammaproteobacteria bacterium]|nr:hypothetical protein [Gammaproteobacteria bacterium]